MERVTGKEEPVESKCVQRVREREKLCVCQSNFLAPASERKESIIIISLWETGKSPRREFAPAGLLHANPFQIIIVLSDARQRAGG